MEMYDWDRFAYPSNDVEQVSSDACWLSKVHMRVVSPPLGNEFIHAPKHGMLANIFLNEIANQI